MTKGTKRTLEDADPDYEDYTDVSSQENKRQKMIEQTGKEASIQKLTDILTKQFDEQEEMMEAAIMDTEDQLHECRQVMERLRGWLVTGYYQNGTESSGDVPTIHPTVKQHLGKAPRNIPKSATEATDIKTPAKQVQQETDLARTVSGTKVADSGKRGSRFKSKKTVIVGNVSMFIPPEKRDELDPATHKWMVYVRGPKDQPDISGFVSKVLFLLDPSYLDAKIEVTEPPFTLTRRGWGQFTIRVQLSFHDRRNKKVDIYHPMKLDRTYTGLQTLGAETTVEIELEKDRTEMINEPKCPKSIPQKLSLESKPITVDHEKATSAKQASQTVSSAKDITVGDKTSSGQLKVKTPPKMDDSTKTLSQNTSVIQPTKAESTPTSISTKSDSLEASKSSKASVPAVPTSLYCIISPSQGASSSTSTPQIFTIQKPIAQQQQKGIMVPNQQLKPGDKITKQQVISPLSLGAPATSVSPRGGGTRLNQLRSVIVSPQLLMQSPKRSTTPSQLIGQAGSVVSPRGVVAGQRAATPVIPTGQVVARTPSGPIYCVLKSPTQLITVRPSTSTSAVKTQSMASVLPASNVAKQIPGILQRSSLPSTAVLKQAPSTTMLKQAASTTPSSTTILKQVAPAISLVKQLPTTQPSASLVKPQIQPQLVLKLQGSPTVSTSKQAADPQKAIQVSTLTTQASTSKQARSASPNPSFESQISTKAATILKQAPIFIQATGKGGQTLLTPTGTKGPLLLQAPGVINPAIRGASALSLLRPVAQPSSRTIIGKKQVSLLTGKTLISTVDKSGAPTVVPPSSQAVTLTSTTPDTQRRILGPMDKSRTVVMKNSNSQAVVSNLVAKIIPKDVSVSNFENLEAIVRFVVRYHPLIGCGNTDRSQHPYCAPSVETFRAWNVAKRRACEWCRASAIRRDVQRIINSGGGGDQSEPEPAELEFEGEKLWTRKDIVLWCRNHCYTPIDDEIKSRLQKGSSQWFGDYASLSEPPVLDVPAILTRHADSDDEEIDVENDSITKTCPLSPYKQRIADEEKRRQGTILAATAEADYVGTVAKQIGVDLAPSELAPGVFGSTASQMIWTVYERIVQDVLRQSCAVLYQNNTVPEEISANEVYRALLSIPVCDFLTNKGLGTKPVCSNVQDIEK